MVIKPFKKLYLLGSLACNLSMLLQGCSNAAVIRLFFQLSLPVHISGFQNQINIFLLNLFSNSRTNTENQIPAYQEPSAGLGIKGTKIKKIHQDLYIPFFLLPAPIVSHYGARFSFLKFLQPFSLSESDSTNIPFLFNFTKSVWAIPVIFPCEFPELWDNVASFLWITQQ